jgi:hypothetical protein
MQIASLAELKKSLHQLDKGEVVRICLSLARYKKENKELLHYLLFEAEDEQSYVEAVKREIVQGLDGLNRSNTYVMTKGIRKVLRAVKKHIRYSGQKETEVQLLLAFCRELQAHQVPFRKHQALENIYLRQLKTAETALGKLHEDLQYDYRQDLEELSDK